MMRHLLSPKVAKAVAASAVGCALLVVPARAHAQDPSGASNALGQGFGDKGQLAITNEGFFGFDKVNHAGWQLVLKPAVDYFVVPSVSAGVVASYVARSGDQSSVGIGARAGFNLNVTPNIGVWPKAGITYEHDKVGSASAATTWVTVVVPFLYHLMPHLFVGLSPYYNLKVAGDGDHSYGFSSVIGGWL